MNRRKPEHPNELRRSLCYPYSTRSVSHFGWSQKLKQATLSKPSQMKRYRICCGIASVSQGQRSAVRNEEYNNVHCLNSK